MAKGGKEVLGVPNSDHADVLKRPYFDNCDRGSIFLWFDT